MHETLQLCYCETATPEYQDLAIDMNREQHRSDSVEQMGLSLGQFQIPLLLEFCSHVLQLHRLGTRLF